MVIKLKFLKRTHSFFHAVGPFAKILHGYVCLSVYLLLRTSTLNVYPPVIFPVEEQQFFFFFLCRWGLWIGIFSSSASTRSLARPQTDTQRQTPCSLCYSDQITMASTQFPMRTLKNTPSSCRFSHLSQLRCVEFKASRTESSFIETEMHEPRRLHVVSVLL